MIDSRPILPGSLVLLGSEGTGPRFGDIWLRLLGSSPRPLTILALQSASPSLVYLARLDLLERTFSGRGFNAQRMNVQEGDPAYPALEADPSSVVIIAAELPNLLHDAEHETSGRISSALLDLIGSGSLLIAGATAAAALGEVILTPVRPFPRDPADLRLSVVRGPGLLTRSVILPYFEHLPAPVIQQVSGLVGPELCLIGIDPDAALVIEPQAAWCAGLGKVTLLRENEVVWEGSGEESIPPEILSISIQR